MEAGGIDPKVLAVKAKIVSIVSKTGIMNFKLRKNTIIHYKNVLLSVYNHIKVCYNCLLRVFIEFLIN